MPNVITILKESFNFVPIMICVVLILFLLITDIKFLYQKFTGRHTKQIDEIIVAFQVFMIILFLICYGLSVSYNIYHSIYCIVK